MKLTLDQLILIRDLLRKDYENKKLALNRFEQKKANSSLTDDEKAEREKLEIELRIAEDAFLQFDGGAFSGAISI